MREKKSERKKKVRCQLFVPVAPLVVLFSLRVSSALVFCFWVASSKYQSSFAIVLCSANWRCLFLSSSSFHHWLSWLWISLFSDVASCERRVPRAPLCGSLRQSDRQSGTSNATTRSAPLRDRWFAVGTLASLCCSLQQRGPPSLGKFSVWS